jgi:hypothetical protein
MKKSIDGSIKGNESAWMRIILGNPGIDVKVVSTENATN